MPSNQNISFVEERIELLTKDLASKRRGTNWSSNLTLFVGLVSLILLCGYFGYGYYMLDDLTKPETIVASAKTYIDDYSADAHKFAAEEIRKSAPTWAATASQELVTNIPTLRENAESSIANYFDEQLALSQVETRNAFKRILEEHRDEFKEAIQLIVEDDNPAEFVDTVFPIFEKQYSVDMKANASNVLGGLQDLNRRLDKLSNGKKLNPIEEQQRHILGLTRLLRDE